jgi:hypothetical protein
LKAKICIFFDDALFHFSHLGSLFGRKYFAVVTADNSLRLRGFLIKSLCILEVQVLYRH